MKSSDDLDRFAKDNIQEIYKIPSQTSALDKKALQLLERIIVSFKCGEGYTYCETGSYLGGTLLPRIANKHCIKAISIDKRVDFQPDERRQKGYSYAGCTSEHMVNQIKSNVSPECLGKLEVFDGSIQEFHRTKGKEVELGSDWIFIDAEHTNIESFNDFLTAKSLLKPTGIIAMHDSWMIYSSIANMKSYLENLEIKHTFSHVNDSVTAFFLGELSEYPLLNKNLFSSLDFNEFLSESKQRLWNFRRRELREELTGKTNSTNHSSEDSNLFASNWFIPGSTLTKEQLRRLPTQVAARTPNALMRVFKKLNNNHPFDIIDLEDITLSKSQENAAQRLCHLFGNFGSDKGKRHGYHKLYGSILDLLEPRAKILEIGLGSKDETIPSNMTEHDACHPGGSLKAFKEFMPESIVDGADIDPSIKVSNCRTFCIDQTKPETYQLINVNGESNYDLIIDDGLHSPDANLNTLVFALGILSPIGFFVVEDIAAAALDIWRVVGYHLQKCGYNACLIKARISYLFVVTKRSDVPRIY